MKNNYSTLTNTYTSNQSIDNGEVFYYNTGDPHDSNSGFNRDDFSRHFGYQIANFQQIFEACKNGILMPFDYAWGILNNNDGPLLLVLFSSSGHPVPVNPKDDKKYGVFCYDVKPPKNSIGNCLTSGNNVVCVLPWSSDKWSRYDKSTPAGV
jgi:hypothetical protein